MNKFQCIANDYLAQIKSQYDCIDKGSIKMEYIAINDNSIKVSSTPYILDNAKVAIVIYYYSYLVWKQFDNNYFVLFMDTEDNIDSSLNIEGWKIEFSEPITSSYRTYGKSLTISKNNLSLSISVPKFDVGEKFPKIWELINKVKQCDSQIELDLLGKLYEREEEIAHLEKDNFVLRYKNEVMEETMKSYKDLLSKIQELISTTSNSNS